ncbi:MAG: response regulator transcription factor [Elusimicrobia bacterium]|nr:response regulator transcription factor [Elusimicrobiota bacterium]
MKGAVVAVLDSTPSSRDLLAGLLASRGWKVQVYQTAGRFFDALLESVPRAAFISTTLRGMDGREVIRVLRSNPETRGMALLAYADGGGRRDEVISGFEAGADEYLETPFDAELIAARLESLLRTRLAAIPADVMELGTVRMDMDSRVCTVSGKAVKLTRLEFDLLGHLMRHRGRVLTRGALLSTVWGAAGSGTRTVDKHVEAVRRKVPPLSKSLETVVNVGYLLR